MSCTTTLNNSYGSAVTVTGAGFLLNDEMDDFATAPGQPNMYGLVQGEANAIAPGKRMLSAMTPSIVLDPDQAAVHDRRHAWRSQDHHDGVPRHLQRDRPPDGAWPMRWWRPRMHHQALPDSLQVEREGFLPEDPRQPQRKGHGISTRGALGRRRGDHADTRWLAGRQRSAAGRRRGRVLRGREREREEGT